MSNKEIFIRKGSTFVKVKLKDVIFIETREDCVRLITQVEEFSIHYTMTAIENLLPSDIFIRVHHTFIVNINMIRDTKENFLYIVVRDTLKTIPIHNSFISSFLVRTRVATKQYLPSHTLLYNELA